MIWGHPHFRKHPYILNAVSAQLRKDFVNPLAFTVGFDPRNIRYCLMHVLHLGVAHFCNGGALLCLMEYDFFGSLPSFYFIAKILISFWLSLRLCSFQAHTHAWSDLAKSHWVDARFKEGIAIRTAGGADHQVSTVDCGQFNPVSWLYIYIYCYCDFLCCL